MHCVEYQMNSSSISVLFDLQHNDKDDDNGVVYEHLLQSKRINRLGLFRWNSICNSKHIAFNGVSTLSIFSLHIQIEWTMIDLWMNLCGAECSFFLTLIEIECFVDKLRSIPASSSGQFSTPKTLIKLK